MRIKTSGLRPKTLRSGIRCTPATLNLEITMLLHQQKRLHSELSALKQREELLANQLRRNADRITQLRVEADALSPDGTRIAESSFDDRPHDFKNSSDTVGREQDREQRYAKNRNEPRCERTNEESYRQMTLSY